MINTAFGKYPCLIKKNSVTPIADLPVVFLCLLTNWHMYNKFITDSATWVVLNLINFLYLHQHPSVAYYLDVVLPLVEQLRHKEAASFLDSKYYKVSKPSLSLAILVALQSFGSR